MDTKENNPPISRAAQLVALLHFPTGEGNEVTFGLSRFAKLPDIHTMGISELVNLGIVNRKDGKGFVTYTATEKMGIPIAQFRAMEPNESWDF